MSLELVQLLYRQRPTNPLSDTVAVAARGVRNGKSSPPTGQSSNAIPDLGHDCRADVPAAMSCGGGESGPTGLPPYVCVRVSPRERRRETLRAGPSSL